MVSPIVFIRQVIDELKKVTWPSAFDVLRLTVIVVIISVIVGLYIGALDFIMTLVMDYLIK